MLSLNELLDPATIRKQTGLIFQDALQGGTGFEVHLEKLPEVVQLVRALTQKNYPNGNVPVHGRYEHLRAGGKNRVSECLDLLRGQDQIAQSVALCDLVVVSVFLDAGAGAQWVFQEQGKTFSRSEGLAVASYVLFKEGFFSTDRSQPLRVDSERLKRITVAELKQGFQVTDSNPLDGLEGRVRLLNQLGVSLEAHTEIFKREGLHRPGNLVHALKGLSGNFTIQNSRLQVPAPQLLSLLLKGFSKMWPARLTVDGLPFGDVWKYSRQNGEEILVPFHKLTQWLCYSLLEPILVSGIEITKTELLTGLPEYRNGGLFLDTGVLELKNKKLLGTRLEPSDAIIIEWRALTVQLLDRVAQEMNLPLPQVLQGGTWSAGREVAAKLRHGGIPPFNIVSDGSVF